MSDDKVAQLQEKLAEKEQELTFFKKQLKTNEAAFHRNESLLHSLVEAAAGKIGQDFFDTIVIRLSEWLNAECVLIGRMIKKESIQAVPLYLDGKIMHDFSYELAGSPCDITTRQGYCEFSENVINLFPKDKILVDLNAEGYIGTALYNNSGEISGVICAVSRKKLQIPPYAKDIMKVIGARVTAEIERLKTEEALKKSETDLKESNSTKDKLISIIAHDLRSPFNTLVGFTDLLIRNFNRYETEKQIEILGFIHLSARNAHNLLENLLEWALAQRDLISFHPTLINFEEIAAESISLATNNALVKEISLDKKIEGNIIVKADKQMLSSVLRNLLSNAIKYTPRGGKVELSAKLITKDGKKLAEVCVEDNGIGMDSDRLAQLFSIDKHFSEPGTEAEKGSGLGLILCKDFIEKNGGVINAQSEPGKGSRFIFSLEADDS